MSKSVHRLIDAEVADQIILIDDCSDDNSYKIAEQLSKKFKNITIKSKEKNEGKGSCIIYAKEFIDSSHMIVHDADLEYDPNDIKELYSASKQNPDSLILGSRTIGNVERNKKYKTLAFINKILAILFSILNNYRVSDITSCYMLMPSNFFKENIKNEKGFSMEIEQLSKFLQTKNEIIEIPISYDGRSYKNGKKIYLFDGLNILRNIIKYSKFFKFFRRK